MTFLFDYLDGDVIDLLKKYIETRRNYNIVLNELKDNILFTIHMNYYENFKSVKSKINNPAWIDYSVYMIMMHNLSIGKKQVLKEIKQLINKKGWIYNFPTVFGWFMAMPPPKNRFNILYIKDKNGDKGEIKGIEIFKDNTRWEYIKYPPRCKNCNSKDLIQYIKIK